MYAGATIRHGSLEDLEKALKAHGPNVAGFLVEPIQGEAGIIVPPEGYMKGVFELCRKHNVLLIADEVQTGLGRTGKMLCIDHDEIKADILILGKALSGGVYPVSAVLADKEIMLCIRPGEHGSTYGGNPLGCAVAMAALKVLKDEGMIENAEKLGQKLREDLNALNCPIISCIRGRGLLNAIEIDKSKLTFNNATAWDICLLMKRKGLLTKPTHENIIRLAPPLCINEEEMNACVRIISESLQEIVTWNKEKDPLE